MSRPQSAFLPPRHTSEQDSVAFCASLRTFLHVFTPETLDLTGKSKKNRFFWDFFGQEKERASFLG